MERMFEGGEDVFSVWVCVRVCFRSVFFGVCCRIVFQECVFGVCAF